MSILSDEKKPECISNTVRVARWKLIITGIFLKWSFNFHNTGAISRRPSKIHCQWNIIFILFCKLHCNRNQQLVTLQVFFFFIASLYHCLLKNEVGDSLFRITKSLKNWTENFEVIDDWELLSELMNVRLLDSFRSIRLSKRMSKITNSVQGW